MPEASQELLLDKGSKGVPATLIAAHAKEDARFHANDLSALGAPAEQELIAAKELIRSSIRRNKHRGCIDMRGCDAICNDMDDALSKAQRRMERRQYLEAMSLAQEVLVIGAKLASEADNSSGSLTDTMDTAFALVTDAATRLCNGGDAKNRTAFDGILKAAKSKAFDGWDDWRYSLLNCAASLADEKSAPRLSALLDHLLAAADQTEYGREYIVEANLETRFYLTHTLSGPQAARDFLTQNLELDRLRELAVSLDMEAGDYARAELLCREKAETAFSVQHTTQTVDFLSAEGI